MTVAWIQGTARHGVTLHAYTLAAAAQIAVIGSAKQIPRHSAVHIDFTDRLFGRSVTEATKYVADELTVIAAAKAQLVVTLHDVPLPDGRDQYQTQRRALYAQVCASALGVIVNSDAGDAPPTRL